MTCMNSIPLLAQQAKVRWIVPHQKASVLEIKDSRAVIGTAKAPGPALEIAPRAEDTPALCSVFSSSSSHSASARCARSVGAEPTS